MYVDGKEKKERKEGKERKKEKKGRDVFKCPPTKPTLPYLTTPHFSHKHNNNNNTTKRHVPTNAPLLQPPKKSPSSSLLLCLSKGTYTSLTYNQICLYFFPIYVGFLGFVLVRVFFHRENRKQSQNLLTRPPSFPHPPLSLSPSYLFYICLYSSFLYSSCSISFLSFILISSFPLSSSSSSSSLLVCPSLFGSCLIL